MTAPATVPQAAPQAAPRASLTHVIQSEWTKLRSVRSTGWTLLVTVAVTVGIGILACWGTNHAWPQASLADQLHFDPVATSLSGLGLGQLAMAVLGVLVISSEYSTGGIRTTLTAVPNRMLLLSGKTLIFLAVAFVTGIVTAFVSFFAGQPWFAERGIGVALGDHDVLRGVIGGALYLTVSGLFGLACGVLLRHTAGAITIAVAFLFVLPLVLLAIPGSVGDAIQRYFTSNAGQQIASIKQNGNYLTPWVGFWVFLAWAVVPLAAGAWLMQRRDA
jgi:hypothetical protein